jgi:hypothetical protein
MKIFHSYQGFRTSENMNGLYYKPITIVNDDSRVINKLETLLSDDARVVSYNHHMFIVQATIFTFD